MYSSHPQGQPLYSAFTIYFWVLILFSVSVIVELVSAKFNTFSVFCKLKNLNKCKFPTVYLNGQLLNNYFGQLIKQKQV